MHPLLDVEARSVIGHRGAAGSAPENTLQSFATAMSDGADALEFDVRLSADGVPVVMHDPTLGRTCNLANAVGGLSVKQLQAADAGYRFTADGGATWPFRECGVRIPTVAQVLDRFPGVPLLIEVKEVEAAGPLARLLRFRGEGNRVVVASFLEAALFPFYDSPPIATGASRRGIIRLWLRASLGLSAPRARYAVYAVPDRYRDRIHVPTARVIRAAHRAGCPVHVWTVDDPDRARMLWERGVSGIITNFPARIVAERRQLAVP
jgi:glycerophosphoryl diester phosphodiesterase